MQLRPYIRAYAQREIAGCSPDIVQPMPASLESIIELDFANPPIVEYLEGSVTYAGRTSLVGSGTCHRHSIRLQSPVDSFGIFLQPLGIKRLFGLPGRLLLNQEYAASAVLPEDLSSLWGQMAENQNFEARVEMVERYLLRAVARASPCTVIMSSAQYIFRCGGCLPIHAVAGQLSLGIRQYERRFLEEIGMSPKLFARIARYQMAMDAKLTKPGRSWLAIAHHFGYHDQMHLIRDFQMLSGDSPSGILSHLGDMRPEALAGASLI